MRLLKMNWLLLTRNNLRSNRYGFKLIPWHNSMDDADEWLNIRYHYAGWLCWQWSWMWSPDKVLAIKSL